MGSAELRARRSGHMAVATLAAVSLVLTAALMPAASSAGAQEASGWSGACGGGIGSAGFADVEGLDPESVAAIDCVAHYGITKGTSATTYSPAALVTRSQMARFLVRTAAALELELPAGDSAPFDDVGERDAEGRQAVARLHEMGITKGRAARVFGPDQTVTRGQMALFLHRLLKLTDVRLPTAGADGFDDLAEASEEQQQAVGAMAALRIMAPAAPARFDTASPVTREDMARFLARILELAGARPVRLEVSVGSEVVLIGGSTEATVRATTPGGEPLPGLLIDVFAAYGTTFDGACRLDGGAHVNGRDAGTSRDCEIDRGDPRTDAAGEVRVGLAHSPQPAVGWVYAWTGAVGQEFDDHVVHAQARVRMGWHPAPDRVTVTGPVRTPFGESVTVRAQLLGGDPGGRRMVLVARQESGAARAHLIAATTGGGVVSFTLAGVRGPLDERKLPVEETVLVFWDRNGNNIHDGPAEPSAQIGLTWRTY